MTTLEEYAEKLDFLGLIITLVLGAFSFLVALLWRDAIKASIDVYFPSEGNIAYLYYAAIAVTLIAGIVTIILIKVRKLDLMEKTLKLFKGKNRLKLLRELKEIMKDNSF